MALSNAVLLVILVRTIQNFNNFLIKRIIIIFIIMLLEARIRVK